MELKIDKASFLQGLRVAQNIADRKSTMPVLANVLLRVTDDKLLVAATDLNVSISAEIPCTPVEAGGLTLGAKALHDIVANLPGDEVSLKKTENNWAEISSGRVNYRLVGMPDRDFPKIPDPREVEYVEVDATTLREMVEKTLFSVCNDETRFHLSGVLFESDGSTARMVSTDGHRLAKAERILEGAPALSAGVIIPKKGITEIKRILDSEDTCRFAIKTPHVFVEAKGLSIAVKLIDSQFPPYSAVIPEDPTRKAVIDRQGLLNALKRTQLMSSDSRGVRFQLKSGSLILSSDNPDVGEVTEELDIEYDGEDMAIGFNGKYVVDFLTAMNSEQVTLELKGELDPGLLRPLSQDDYLGVVMPMRI